MGEKRFAEKTQPIGSKYSSDEFSYFLFSD
jgi:hypothetical protein